jgi:hypothetical protein
MRFVFCVLLFFVAHTLAIGQGEKNSLKGTPFKERIVTGGGFGLGFSSTSDFFSVSPMIGYQVTTRFMAGTGFTYRFTNYKTSPPIKLNDYGINPFLRFIVYKNIFLQTEYEYLNYEFPTSFTESVRQEFGSFLAGGGFVQPISSKVGIYFMALYNFSYKTPIGNDYTPYNSPLVIRAGVNVGNFGF